MKTMMRFKLLLFQFAEVNSDIDSNAKHCDK